MSPDMANIIIREILHKKPKIILECGSGVSTLIVSYCLKIIGRGHIISLDHEEKYCDITKSYLEMHGLHNWTEVVHAPLRDVIIGGRKWQWYDISFLKDISLIDLLIIDGPPRSNSNLIRYPALPLLVNRLNKDAVVIIDDTSRQDEKSTIKLWIDEYREYQYEEYDTEKGTGIMRRFKNI